MLYTTVKAGKKEYKCRLNTRAFVDLERRLGTNPLNVLSNMASGSNQVPSLETMLTIFQASLQSLEHGITMDDVFDIYDDYLADGNSFVDFMNVIVEIIENSGILPKDKKAEEEEKELKN